MLKRRDYFTTQESWTTILASNPFIAPLTEFFAKIHVTPNQVTILSFIIALGAIYLYFTGRLFIGALIWHLSFIFDCVDGCLARKLKKTSDFGAKLDHTLHKVKKAFAIIAIIYATHTQYNLVIMISMVILHYLLHRVRYGENRAIMEYLNSKGIKSLFDPLDEQFFIVFLGPITGYVFQFVLLTVVIQLLNIFIHFVKEQNKSRKSSRYIKMPGDE